MREARGGTLKRHFLAPGSLIPDADHIARVSVRVLATVAELRKRLGDSVEKGEIVAVIESREVADAKSEYLAARVTNELRQTLFNRQQSAGRNPRRCRRTSFCAPSSPPARRRSSSTARGKNCSRSACPRREIADLPNQPPESLRKQYLRAPMSGRISERRVDLGGLIGREGQESELFVIVNLDNIWVDLAVSPEDIGAVREGEPITIRAIGIEGEASAQDHLRQPAARPRDPQRPRHREPAESAIIAGSPAPS